MAGSDGGAIPTEIAGAILAQQYNALAQGAGIPNSPYIDPAYSKKFDGNGSYSPQWVEDFTESTKFDHGVGGGIDHGNSPLQS